MGRGIFIYTLGTGTVEICISANHKFQLDDVLFVPASTICLISVPTLHPSGGVTSHTDEDYF